MILNNLKVYDQPTAVRALQFSNAYRGHRDQSHAGEIHTWAREACVSTNSSMEGFHKLNRFQNISQHEGRPYKLKLPAKIWGQAGIANKMLVLTI